MKIGNILLGTIALGGIFYFLKSAKKLTKLDVSLAGLKLDSKATNIQETVFQANLSVYNPNQNDVVFQSFTGNVFSTDKIRLGNIDTLAPKGTMIKARESATIPVKLVIPNANVLQSLIPSLILSFKGKEASLPETMLVSGVLKAENLPALPVLQTIRLKA